MYLYVSMWFMYSRVVGEDTNHGQSEAYTILTKSYFELNRRFSMYLYVSMWLVKSLVVGEDTKHGQS